LSEKGKEGERKGRKEGRGTQSHNFFFRIYASGSGVLSVASAATAAAP